MPTTISKITTAETQQFIDSEPQSFESITDEDIAAYKEHHKVLFAKAILISLIFTSERTKIPVRFEK